MQKRYDMNCKRLIPFAVVMMFLGSIVSYAETKTARFTKPFNEIEVYGGAVVYYNVRNTSKPYMNINGLPEKVKNLHFTISGNKLKIGPKNRGMNNRGNSLSGVTINVYAPAVTGLEANSGANLNLCNALSVPSKKVEVEVSSGARIKLLTVNCKKLDLEASSGSSLTVSAVKAGYLSIESSSAGRVVCNSINTDYIDCEASSAGSITVAGSSKRGDFDSSSAGKINTANFRCGGRSESKANTGGSIIFP